MRLIRTLKQSPIVICIFLLNIQMTSGQVCSNPANIIYGMDGNGGIFPVNVNTAAVGARINPAFPGNPAASPNAMGYNSTNGRFYFFKRNADQAPQEFVSFDPVTNTYAALASCPTVANIKTGCVNANSTGYYCIDVNANLYFYRFLSNNWKLITGTFFNQFGANISATLAAHSSGDIAMDGWGNLWFLCSEAATYGLFQFPGSLPVAPVASISIIQKIAPTTPTPTGNTFAGIAFSPTGQIYMSQYGDDRIYRLNNNLSLTLLGTTSTSGVGTDLTSCNFPMVVLAINWQDFAVESRGDQQNVISWTGINDNIKGYFIEHSADAGKWTTLGFVENTSNLGKYSFTDAITTDGRYYYRIRQVGFDGQYAYSEVKFVDIKLNNLVSVGPNPTNGMLQVRNNVKTFSRISILDLTGHMIMQSSLVKGSNLISISSLPAGPYMIRLQSEKGETFHQKIIKE